jgi:HSP20 family protein
MSYYIAPYPYRLAQTWADLAGLEPECDLSLPVDVREDDQAYTIHALTPGLKAEDLNIQVLEDTLTIQGEFKTDDQDYLLSELPHGTFSRVLHLPAAVDAAKADAKIKDGVMTLRLPKAESSRPKTIKVAVK